MVVEELENGSLTFVPERHEDERGELTQAWERDVLEDAVKHEITWVQANVTQSQPYVFRGIHYSLAPEGQAKYVTCVSGSILDMTVDLREGSPTFGIVSSAILTPEHTDGPRSMYVPAGYGHGFYVFGEGAVVHYMLSSGYDPRYERDLRPVGDLDPASRFDPDTVLNIWMNERDRDAPTLESVRHTGVLPQYPRNATHPGD